MLSSIGPTSISWIMVKCMSNAMAFGDGDSTCNVSSSYPHLFSSFFGLNRVDDSQPLARVNYADAIDRRKEETTRRYVFFVCISFSEANKAFRFHMCAGRVILPGQKIHESVLQATADEFQPCARVFEEGFKPASQDALRALPIESGEHDLVKRLSKLLENLAQHSSFTPPKWALNALKSREFSFTVLINIVKNITFVISSGWRVGIFANFLVGKRQY
jgi:hypothetical protein